jgi:phage shock protein PspC (stress-responsive transcriptional regulator)
MNDITRIHIAKTPYNIEQAAKKALQEYLLSLEAVIDDTETMQDIETRMTELLAERSVKSEGVIDMQDVNALKEQLGTPADFGDEAVNPLEKTATTIAQRKLFRNPDGAWLGGVINGLAAYTHTPVFALRLAALGLLLLTRGAAVVAYLIAWLIIPRVTSASEKLQLIGKPVTAEAMSAVGPITASKDGLYLSVLRIAGGIGAIVLAIAAIVGGVVLATHKTKLAESLDFTVIGDMRNYNLDFWHAAFTVSLIAIFTTVSLLGVAAYAAFAKRVNRRIVSSGIVLAVLTISLAISSVVLIYTQHERQLAYFDAHRVERTLDLPNQAFSAIRSELHTTDVTYIVTNTKPVAKYNYQSLSQSGKTPTIVIENGVLTITEKADNHDDFDGLIIEGPALSKVDVSKGSISYQAGEQAELQLLVAADAAINISGTKLTSVNATLDQNAQLSADGITIDAFNFTAQTGAYVSTGDVQQVTGTIPQSCGSDNMVNLNFGIIKTKQIRLNDQSYNLENYQTTVPCGIVTVANEF